MKECNRKTGGVMKGRNRKITNRNIALLAVFLGLMLLFSLATPIVGLFGVIGTAFIMLVIIAAAALSEGLIVGTAAGAMFGLVSFVVSFMIPQPLAASFHNPVISVLPRIFIGVVVFYSHKFLKKTIRNPHKKKILDFVRLGVPAALGALFNTLSVLGLIALFDGGDVLKDGRVINAELILLIMATNGVFELILTFLLTPPIVAAMIKFKRANSTIPYIKTDKKTDGNNGEAAVNDGNGSGDKDEKSGTILKTDKDKNAFGTENAKNGDILKTENKDSVKTDEKTDGKSGEAEANDVDESGDKDEKSENGGDKDILNGENKEEKSGGNDMPNGENKEGKTGIRIY
ncbi:MAG: hypothetical protein LBP62_06435 [Clostridiales bacterium]|jgi:uncharacterized membrane protein|nr:hypothetical protein [Clostridiales bacterium]